MMPTNSRSTAHHTVTPDHFTSPRAEPSQRSNCFIAFVSRNCQRSAMSAGSTSTSGLDPIAFPPTPTSISDLTSIPSSSSSPLSSSAAPTEAVLFSSGNPRIEETRGVMHLYRDITPSSSTSTSTSSSVILPIGRKPLVCVLAVPNHMTYADFCKFCGSFIQHMLEMRIVRIDGVDEQYSVIIRFDEQSFTDDFYKHFNRKRFSSLEEDICCVRYTVDVQQTESIERAQSSVSSSADCPVCLERLDQDKDSGGILTTICNHSFHCSCISKWTDSSCPVCRYCQQQAESTCSICGQSENLWLCVICGFVGCGRYKEGHAVRHWKETQHCYSLELETQRVWDYVGDNYVHRLIQSKTDGKLVEISGDQQDEISRTCDCDEDLSEALLNSKVEAIVEEYNNLLTSQLENQRKHFESLLLEIKEGNDKEIDEAVEKALHAKLPKLQLKLNKAIEEKTFLEEINKNLLENQEMWEEKIGKAEKREQISTRLKDLKIKQLEEQLSALIAQIESVTTDGPTNSAVSEIKNATVITLPSANNNTGETSGKEEGN
ncbi:zinc finger (ubiquitin-hydrolase) domain-containing protein [Rhynchospora pubera]|uniref:Zinc finger (Ubiquitin-hydrolase) domain-containing protein n=1 Tax=Rhynchospora pubera TaxID=906938 RepID=A0AAV8C097_9POAL|nr:zinc finger (ubiquitin-hydrolase) domain-containing protein [Rhynchospora pubera]